MAEESNYINFNFVSFQQFKKAFIKATDESKTVFTFEGNEFDSGYAKYLIEYLEAHFGKEK